MYRSGNAWALLIQKAILELLDIDPETDELELTVENKVLMVKKAEKIKNVREGDRTLMNFFTRT